VQTVVHYNPNALATDLAILGRAYAAGNFSSLNICAPISLLCRPIKSLSRNAIEFISTKFESFSEDDTQADDCAVNRQLSPEEELLQKRLGLLHANLRLGIEADHEAQVFGQGINYFHPRV
jgi:hypothetical protein